MGKRGRKGALYDCVLSRRCLPFHAVLFATPFLTMHILLFLTIALMLLGHNIVALILGCITLARGISYFKQDIHARHPLRTIIFAGLRYAANLALLLGGLLGGSKLRMMYISATLDYNKR